MCRSGREKDSIGKKRRCECHRWQVARATAYRTARRAGRKKAIDWAESNGQPEIAEHLRGLSDGVACHTAVALGVPADKAGLVMKTVDFGFQDDSDVLRSPDPDFSEKYEQRYRDAGKGWTQTQRDYANRINEGKYDELFMKLHSGEPLSKREQNAVDTITSIMDEGRKVPGMVWVDQPLLDKKGFQVRSSTGEPLWELIYDEDGNAVYDKDGKEVRAKMQVPGLVLGTDTPTQLLYSSIDVNSALGKKASETEIREYLEREFTSGSTYDNPGFLRTTHDPALASQQSSKSKHPIRVLMEVSTRESTPLRGRKRPTPNGETAHSYSEVLPRDHELVVRSIRRVRVPVGPGSKKRVDAFVVQMMDARLVDERTANEDVQRRWAYLPREMDINLPVGATLPAPEKGLRSQNRFLSSTFLAKDGTPVWRHPSTGVVYARSELLAWNFDADQAKPFDGEL